MTTPAIHRFEVPVDDQTSVRYRTDDAAWRADTGGDR